MGGTVAGGTLGTKTVGAGGTADATAPKLQAMPALRTKAAMKKRDTYAASFNYHLNRWKLTHSIIVQKAGYDSWHLPDNLRRGLERTNSTGADG
jgi:hypothetical protein